MALFIKKWKEKKGKNYCRKSATASHHSLSFQHSSMLLPFPSPIRWHLRRCTAFWICPHWQVCSPDLPMTLSYLFKGPLSVTMYVKALTCFLDHWRCFGLLWIGWSCLIPAGVIRFSLFITLPGGLLLVHIKATSSWNTTPWIGNPVYTNAFVPEKTLTSRFVCFGKD